MSYITVDDLRRIPRLEEDVELPESSHRFRVSALTQEQVRTLRRRSFDADGRLDEMLSMQLGVAFGLVRPALNAEQDEEGALEIVRCLPVATMQLLAARITQLTDRNASEAFKELFDTAVSPTGGAATPVLSLISASS